jgi:hypothetical protein
VQRYAAKQEPRPGGSRRFKDRGAAVPDSGAFLGRQRGNGQVLDEGLAGGLRRQPDLRFLTVSGQ